MPNPPISDEEIQESVDVYIRCGYSTAAAALERGISSRTMRRHLQLAEQRGVSVPRGRVAAPPPMGLSIRGVSTLHGPDGEIKAQWIKTDRDKELLQEAMDAAFEAMKEDLPRRPPVAPPPHTQENLCNVYTLTDCHVGMLAWRHEGGADWDLKIAERTLIGCFERMIATSPEAHTAVVAQLGDFLHWDGLEAVTPTSGHNLDADGRFEKIVKVAIRILRHIVDFALHHHSHVHVLMAEGNHDIASSVWLRQMFAALYENDPRVTVETSPLPYYALEWGDTALFWHHGHLKKFDKLPSVFPVQFPEIWGRTKKRYGHAGHFHHVKVNEDFGMEMRQHATLAARDAYASRGGYFAMRNIKAFTYHKTYGEVRNETVWPEMIGDEA